MARHHAVADADILAQTWRGALERDAVVITVSHHAFHHHVMASVDVEGVVVVIVAVENLDTIDAQPVASQVVLHPTAGVAQRDIFHHNVTALDEAQQMWTCDSLIVP